MRPFIRILAVAALLSWPGSFLIAQSPIDPSGHWEGSIQIPNSTLGIELDLARDSTGQITGTIGNNSQKGFPLAAVALKDRSISFRARVDQPFEGVLSADRASISGTVRLEGYALPFATTRTGEPRIKAAARSAAIGKELEGAWNGTLGVNGKELRFLLTMTNHADGKATASIVSLDEGQLHIPVTVAQKASTLTLDLEIVGSAYSGAVNVDGTELIGTYTQGTFSAPLTFRRASDSEGRR